MMLKPQVLLVALGDWNGVCRLPRVLSRAGAEVTLLVLPRGMARRTRFAKALPMEGYGVEQIVLELRAHLAEHPGRYQMIIPGDDMTMHALASEAEVEWLRPWFCVDPTPEKLEILLSTDTLIRTCAAAGLPTPKSIFCQDLDAAAAAAESIGYPVFFKGEQSSGGGGVGLAQDEASLRAVAATIEPHYRRTFSVQKAIRGASGSTLILAQRGEVIQWLGTKKVKTWPGPYSVSTQREFFRHPDLELMARTMARIMDYSGFFTLDWIHCADTDRLMIVEMNPRPTPEFTIGVRDGADFAEGVRYYLSGGPKPKPLAPTAQAGRFQLFPQELFRCLDQRDLGGLLAWAGQILRNGGDVPWDDRSLFVGMLKKLLRHRRNEKRKRQEAAARPS